MPAHRSDPFDIPLAELRRRRSAKWSHVAPDVVPAWVAEMDVRLAPAISRALHEAIDLGDTGYAGDPTGAVEALAGFARDRWQWDLDPSRVRVFPDLRVAAVTIIRHVLQPGDGVIVTPPVYNSFFHWLPEAGARTIEVPLLAPEHGGRLDIAGFERALSGGARIILLSTPHNPTGRVFSRDELAELAALAHRHGALVIADEIHAPLAHPGVEFVPWMTVSEEARATGIALESASKAWNLAGLKAAFTVSERDDIYPADQTPDNAWAAGLMGLIAAETAFRDGRDWLDDVRAALADRARLLGDLLGEHLPEVGYHPPSASYLAWLDISALPLGPNPMATLLEEGRLFASAGSLYGAENTWLRLNIGSSVALVEEYVRRIASVVAARRS